MKAAIYARISLDRHDGEGVARQLADCRAIAAERGWDTIEFVDNDISAFRARRRPGWEQLLAALEAGEVGAVIAYHPDRLYRRLADLERLIVAIDAASVAVVTVRAGDVDLSTATGRMTARIIGAVASAESERTGERVSRAKRERAAQGRPAGGGRRPFGLTADRQGLVPEEAELLRSVAAEVLAGATLGSQVRRLNDMGSTTTAGGEWSSGVLRRVLISPHVAGLRAYRGEVVAEATHPPILDRPTWDALRAGASSRERGRPPADRYLLTGLVRCGACDRPMYGNTFKSRWVYLCSVTQRSSGRGCSRSIAGPRLDRWVSAEVDRILADPEWQRALAEANGHGAPAPDPAKVVELERRRNLIAARWAAGEISDGEFEAARRASTEQLDRLAAARPARLPLELATIATVWTDQPIAARRSIIATVALTPLMVGPGRIDGNLVEVEDRVEVAARWVA